ncbi:hypothetical protein [Burkholderia sp. Tr-20390]|uniref:hypothetical protein n=1 Tax=Burkholderia sp. Tr-20390 TaxID=2703904 RepID=UPI00197E96C0|nr:hypothetical protein [Burkholderia sp. Tr-20390]MBN3733161.1 hypothetical protein [Burkholderia sp. Tr-20390]
MTATTARDALLAEVLSELIQLHDVVTAMSAAIPLARKEIENGGDLAVLRFKEEAERVFRGLDTRTTQFREAVKEVGAMKEALIAAVATQAADDARTRLLEAVREVAAEPRTRAPGRWLELVVCSAAGTLFGGAFVLLALNWLHLLPH